jgi:hypothetical protein
MSPGPLTTCHRGGNFYAGRTAPRAFNRAIGTPAGHVYGAPHGRAYPGERSKFAVTSNGNGGHSVTLADNETATLIVGEDGALSISIENKPQRQRGSGGNDNGTAVHAEPVENARRAAGRQISKMSWERDPSDGSVTFTPDDNETLHVSGDAIMATVAVEPSPPGSLD